MRSSGSLGHAGPPSRAESHACPIPVTPVVTKERAQRIGGEDAAARTRQEGSESSSRRTSVVTIHGAHEVSKIFCW